MLPRSILSVASLLTHVLAIPACFLVSVFVYRSAWTVAYLDMGVGRLTLNTLMLMCIILGVLCASRIPMVACRKHLHLKWVHYVLWSIAEIVLMALFMGLYMALMYKHTEHAVGSVYYFPNVGKCMSLLLTTVLLPYLFINALFSNFRDSNQQAQEDNLVRFTDSTQRLKLVISAEAILYIKADENYVNICYLDGDRQKEYALRNSMRAIEPVMQKAGIVRCQRSYFVNPRHVTVLRKDKEGMIAAELDRPQTKPIPVSPKYYDSLNQLL
ncbi:MAG: LytTR family DNA-binding domain-containing protein [Paludibacteraceae bacterium]